MIFTGVYKREFCEFTMGKNGLKKTIVFFRQYKVIFLNLPDLC